VGPVPFSADRLLMILRLLMLFPYEPLSQSLSQPLSTTPFALARRFRQRSEGEMDNEKFLIQSF